MKNQRHKAILEIINEQPVATQEVLMMLLAERGIHTAQATLSRDIQQLSLVKQRDENGVYRYALPPTAQKITVHSRAVTTPVSEFPSGALSPEKNPSKHMSRITALSASLAKRSPPIRFIIIPIIIIAQSCACCQQQKI